MINIPPKGKLSALRGIQQVVPRDYIEDKVPYPPNPPSIFPKTQVQSHVYTCTLRGVGKVVPHGSEGHDPCQEEDREGRQHPFPLKAAVSVRHLVGLNEPRVVAIRCARYETEAPEEMDRKNTHTVQLQ